MELKLTTDVFEWTFLLHKEHTLQPLEFIWANQHIATTMGNNLLALIEK